MRPIAFALERMAVNAVQAKRCGKEAHRFHKLVHWDSLEDLNVPEDIFRHWNFLLRNGLRFCRQNTNQARHNGGESCSHRLLLFSLHTFVSLCPQAMHNSRQTLEIHARIHNESPIRWS